MDIKHFDDVVRGIPEETSRRGVLGAGFGALAAMTLAAFGFSSGDRAEAKKKKRRLKVCLGGETIEIRRSRKEFYLSIGATPGRCNPNSPPPNSPPPNFPPPPPGCPACNECEECVESQCQPKSAGSSCGDGKVCLDGVCSCPGENTACQELCCTECQICDEADFLCVMEPGSDSNACADGACCGGACCPTSCQCGLSGAAGQIAPLVAEFFDLPNPFCVAAGSGPFCGQGFPACPSGLTCQSISTPAGIVGVCADLCPGVSYPSL